LRAARGDDDWDDQEVLAEDVRTVAAAKSTAFKIVALDANPADGRSFGTKSLAIANLPAEKIATTICDPTSRRCRGSFAFDTTAGKMSVRHLSEPTVIRAGRSESRQICVAHGGLSATCVPEGGLDVVTAAEGEWILETALKPGETPEPGPKLKLTFTYACR
jgi:hypothetical protein